MFIVTILRRRKVAAPREVFRFVCPDESRANFHAGAEVDRLADETGARYDYTVTPVEVRT